MNSAVVVLPIFGIAVAAVSGLFLDFRKPLAAHVAAPQVVEPQTAVNARAAAESAAGEVVTAEVAAQLQEYADRPLSVTVLGLPANHEHDSRWQKHVRAKHTTARRGSHRAIAGRPAGIPAGPLAPRR